MRLYKITFITGNTVDYFFELGVSAMHAKVIVLRRLGKTGTIVSIRDWS